MTSWLALENVQKCRKWDGWTNKWMGEALPMPPPYPTPTPTPCDSESSGKHGKRLLQSRRAYCCFVQYTFGLQNFSLSMICIHHLPLSRMIISEFCMVTHSVRIWIMKCMNYALNQFIKSDIDRHAPVPFTYKLHYMSIYQGSWAKFHKGFVLSISYMH